MGQDGGESGVTGLWTSPARAALFEASGRVVDPRRLVVVIYLLIRDCLPLVTVDRALDAARVESWTECASHLDADTIQSVRDRASRVHDAPGSRLYVFMYRLHLTHDVWRMLDSTLPLRDDVQTHFSNGWLAQYAQHVVNALTE